MEITQLVVCESLEGFSYTWPVLESPALFEFPTNNV